MARPYLDTTDLERHDLWLDAVDQGATTTRDIANATGYTIRRVQQCLAAARNRRCARPDPRLYPVYPGGGVSLSEATTAYEMAGVCNHVHTGDAPDDPLANCEVCNRSRLDYLWVGTDKRVIELPRPDGKAKPTCYSPDPQLKGGVG